MTKLIQACLLIISYLLAASSLHASNVGFLKYAVIKDFSESDISQLQQEYLNVLQSGKLGERHQWKNAETTNGGEIVVIKQYLENGNQCKRLKIKNQSKNNSAISYFNFCLIEKEWKLVNE